MEIARFEKLVAQAFRAFPKRLREALDNVEIVIEDSPRRERRGEIRIAQKGILLGLYEGVPQTIWGRKESGVLPDKITIFKKPIESLAHSEQELQDLVRDTVWHELGHHFGFTDIQLRAIEQRRRSQKSKRVL